MPNFMPLLGVGKKPVAASGGIDAPTDISGCVGWWDFSDNTTVFSDYAGTTQAVNDGTVRLITDKTGNSRNFGEGTGTKLAVYKTGIQNGKNAGYFGGLSRMVTLANPGGILRNVAGTTMFLVVSEDADDAGYSTVQFNTAQSGGQYLRAGITIHSGKPQVEGNNTDILGNRKTLACTTSIGTNTFAIVTGKLDYANGDGFIYLNGSLDASSTSLFTNGNTPDTDGLGGTVSYGLSPAGYLKGYIGEFIIYNVALSDADRTKVEAYLNNKWGVYS